MEAGQHGRRSWSLGVWVWMVLKDWEAAFLSSCLTVCSKHRLWLVFGRRGQGTGLRREIHDNDCVSSNELLPLWILR